MENWERKIIHDRERDGMEMETTKDILAKDDDVRCFCHRCEADFQFRCREEYKNRELKREPYSEWLEVRLFREGVAP